MRTVLIRLTIPIVVCLLLAMPMFAQAQAAQANLVAWAALPAQTLADGSSAGQKLGAKTTNGLKIPFASQPVGSITAILPGDYANSWLVLSNSSFGSPQNSADYLLRIYTIEVSWHDANGGDGTATVVDWISLTDPAKKVAKPIQNASAANRPLSGGDFTPRAFQRVGDGSFWVAEAAGPSLLHFGRDGKLSSSVGIHTYDTGSRAFGSGTATFPLANGANNVSGLAMVNDHQALIIEEDGNQGKDARFKQVFLVDLQASSKTQLVDLLNISDPGNIAGQGTLFKFPFKDIGAIYPLDAQTLVIANDNNVPFGNVRNPAQADNTEYIAVQIGQPLNLDGAFNVPR